MQYLAKSPHSSSEEHLACARETLGSNPGVDVFCEPRKMGVHTAYHELPVLDMQWEGKEQPADRPRGPQHMHKTADHAI